MRKNGKGAAFPEKRYTEEVSGKVPIHSLETDKGIEWDYHGERVRAKEALCSVKQNLPKRSQRKPVYHYEEK